MAESSVLVTKSTKWRKARTTSATDSSFPSKIPTGTQPSGDGVHPCGYSSGICENAIKVIPYGIGNDNHTFDMRVISWEQVGDDPNNLLWVPTILVQLACTLSTMVGVAGRQVINTERFSDTITLTTGNDDISVDIVSPTGEVGATAVIDLKGAQLLEFTFDLGAGTDANCLWKFL